MSSRSKVTNKCFFSVCLGFFSVIHLLWTDEHNSVAVCVCGSRVGKCCLAVFLLLSNDCLNLDLTKQNINQTVILKQDKD